MLAAPSVRRPQFATQPPLLLAGCALFGLGVGVLITLPPLIVQVEFPPALVDHVVALFTAVNQCFFACAPVVFGALRDLLGSYIPPFLLGLLCQFGGWLLLLLATRSQSRPALSPG